MAINKARLAAALSDRELGTILAALRLWQSIDMSRGIGISAEFTDIALDADGTRLSNNEIDALCERLNCD